MTVISSDTVNVSWTIPSNDNSCITHYTITVTSNDTDTVYTGVVTTSLLIPGLNQRVNYSFTVHAIDYGGRVGDTSESVTVLLDGIIIALVLLV